MAAREYQALKKDAEIAERQGIEKKKTERATKKQQKEKKKAQRQAVAAKKRRIAEEVKAAKAAERLAQQELRETARREKAEQERLRKESIEVRKATRTQKKVAKKPKSTIVEEEVKEVIKVSSRGRQLQRSKRLRD